jgi:arabinoxylan arabinofuranohydrolase
MSAICRPDSLRVSLMTKPNRLTKACLARSLGFLLGVAAIPMVLQAANPFLPSYEYIPDGSPRVFGDRLYLYGSHDKAGSERFCDYILKVWSAPLNDLNTWTDHGIMLATRDVDGHKKDYPHSDYEFYAPDLIEVGGKYYYFAQVVGAPCVVAVSDTPAGPFKIISTIKAPAGAPKDFGGWSQYFDPGLLLDDDGKVYIYWGGGSSHLAQLDPKTMTDILPDTYRENILPKAAPYHFQEGISPHKINGVYYLVYAQGENMAYATSKSPTGPFDYRGVIVSHKVDANSGNIHGGLAQLNGQWHVFYHRMSNRSVFSRRACVERVMIEADGSIKQVEQTSLGFETSLNPYKFTQADIACVFRGGSYVTELDKRTHPVRGNKHDCVVGYKYFDFGDTILPGQSTLFTLEFRNAQASGQVEVWLGDPKTAGEKLGSVSIDQQEAGKDSWREITIPIRNLSGRHAVYFKFTADTKNTPIADIRSFTFTRDTR